jgi:VanZ family protein
VNLVYAALLIVLAVLPQASTLSRLGTPDWLAHAAAYGIQGGLVFWAIGSAAPRCRRAATGVGTAVVFGAATEALQLVRPERSVELTDLAANAVGAAVVVGILVALDRLRSRTSG